MKATDLMIGDWVYDGYNKARVVGITCDGNVETTYNEKSNIELLEPIPLTGEILEKNFAKRLFFDGEFEGYSYVTDGMQIDQLADSVFEWICPGTINGILNLKYVHELQHVLRLCGIEKDIVL